MTNLKEVKAQYETEVDNLPIVHSTKGGGQARNESGLVYENLIKRTCQALGFVPKKNDYVRTEVVNGACLANLQVDWHVYKEGVMSYLIESKTYLDSCYLKRAIMDFIELHNSPDVPDNVEYAIIAGQNACGADAFKYYQEYFTKITGKTVRIFFLNPQRKRSSARPIYKSDHREDFVLDADAFGSFVNWLF